MSKITRKLLLAVLTVVLTVATLGTTTFAWFTLTNTSVIQNFNVDIIGDSGIQMALATFDTEPGDLQWRETITAPEVLAFIEAQFGATFVLNHVSSPDGINFYGLGIGAPGGSTSSGYLELPIHFRSEDVDQIAWTQVSLTSGAFSWRTPITFIDSKAVERLANSTFNVNAADAMRISVTGDILSTPSTVAYENPISATNTVLGLQSGSDLTAANGAISYYFNSTATYPGGIATVNTINTITTLGTGVHVLDLTGGQTATYENNFYGRVMLRVWFEGWDAEAYNALLSRTITVRFQFEAL